MTTRSRRPHRLAVTMTLSAGLLLAGALPSDAAVRDTDDSCPAADVPQDAFTDVDRASTHAASIGCVVWWGVAKGTTASTYSPAAAVNRAQMATFVVNVLEAAGAVFPPEVPNAFDDDAGSTHEASIDKLALAGVVGGTGPRTYSPAAPVTRAQMASYLVRAHAAYTREDLADPGRQFSDTAGSTHESNINRVAAAGFTGGITPTTYAPDAPVRRDAMASFLVRVLDLLVEDGWTNPPSQPEAPPPAPPSDVEGPPGSPPGS